MHDVSVKTHAAAHFASSPRHEERAAQASVPVPVSAGPTPTGEGLLDATGERASPSMPPSDTVAGSKVSKSWLHAGAASAAQVEATSANQRRVVRLIKKSLGHR
jgi:hypothetical protein